MQNSRSRFGLAAGMAMLAIALAAPGASPNRERLFCIWSPPGPQSL